jgi:ABC-type uncharacterized transport system involved in gliding motility auxiliary subunit
LNKNGDKKMKLVDRIIGITGIVIFLFSLVYYSIQNVWGTLNWITLLLGLAGVGYFLFVYYKNRDKEFSIRSLQYGSNVLVQILIVIGIVGFLAFITTRQHIRSDLTVNKLYSLADQTDKILDGLEREVQIIAFYKTSEQRAAQDLLDEYSYRSSNLKYEFVDPDEKPQVARQYQVSKYNTIVVESGIKREIIEELNETNLTNAIMKVTREQDKVIYFLTGHGERSISDESPQGYKNAVEAIKKENHVVRELNLARQIGSGRGISDSCTVLVILSPKSTFFPAEFDSIRSYLDRGGKVFFLLDPDHNQDVVDFLLEYRVRIGNDLVVDASGVGQLFGAGPAMPLVTDYDQSITITKDFGVMTFYPITSSVTPLEDKGGYDIKEILKSSGNSWAEVDYSSGEVSFDQDKDLAGPVTLAVLVEKTNGDTKMGLVIFGDSDFASNGHWKNQGNSNIFLNTINYLAEEEDLISIRPKDVDDRRVTLTQADVKTIFYLVVIAIPLLVVIAGVVFYIRRGR